VKQVPSIQDQPKSINGDHKKVSAKDPSQEKKASGIKIPVSHGATTGNKK